jgi:DNA modification methylase
MDYQIIHGDCLDVMDFVPPLDCVVTDPPYGCGKAEWDESFPKAWYQKARMIAPLVVIITGSCGLMDSIPLVGEDFIDIIAARNMNGMTRGPIGYGNWLAAVIAGKKPKMGPNAFDFSVSGKKPDHPSPKPIQYMRKLIERVSNEGDLILDPFMGSGTTGVACIETGRRFIGIEREAEYCEIAEKRIAQAVANRQTELVSA